MKNNFPKTSRLLACGTAGAIFHILSISQAYSLDAGVRMACASDYFTHCSAYSPSSPKVRSCMRSVGPNLSKGCIQALKDAGEIPSYSPSQNKDPVSVQASVKEPSSASNPIGKSYMNYARKWIRFAENYTD
ncbi:MAG: hypothetical protein ACKOW3_02195 [Hyphomicrobium sp.]